MKKKKKRRLKIKNLLMLLSFPVVIIGLLVFFGGDEGNSIEVSPIANGKFDSFFESKDFSDIILSPSEAAKLDLKKLRDSNYISYKNIKELDADLYSRAYLLIDLENRDALYGLNNSEKIYPASLTKLMTLDAILALCHDDLDQVSSFTSRQRDELIVANASLAYLKADTEYTVRDLLYALLLPSGADAAKALENLCEERGFSLIEYMKKQAEILELSNTSFINTTGLHDDEHYTTLDDMFRIVWDILKYREGRNLLSTVEYTTEDGVELKSTLKSLREIEEVDVLGGKTGFTGEAGENIFVFYECDEKTYALFLAGANGNPYHGESYHFDDVKTIVKKLYISDVE